VRAYRFPSAGGERDMDIDGKSFTPESGTLRRARSLLKDLVPVPMVTLVQLCPGCSVFSSSVGGQLMLLQRYTAHCSCRALHNSRTVDNAENTRKVQLERVFTGMYVMGLQIVRPPMRQRGRTDGLGTSCTPSTTGRCSQTAETIFATNHMTEAFAWPCCGPS